MALRLLLVAGCALGSRVTDDIFEDEEPRTFLELESKDEQCSNEEIMNLYERFEIGPNHQKPCFVQEDWADSMIYSNPEARTTFSLFFYPVEDHNGAFNVCQVHQQKYEVNPVLCSRLLQQSKHYSVLFQRVETVEEAITVVKGLSPNIVIKHLVLGGHGSPEGIEWGPVSVEEGTPVLAVNDKVTDSFFDAIFPHLKKGETEYSTVFLDSCLGGATVCYTNMLQYVAHKLSGVKVFASKVVFQDSDFTLRGDGVDFDGKIEGFLKKNMLATAKYGTGELKDWKMDTGMYCNDMKKQRGVKTMVDCHKLCDADESCAAFIYYESIHTVPASKKIFGEKMKFGHKKCFLSNSCAEGGPSKQGALVFFKPGKE